MPRTRKVVAHAEPDFERDFDIMAKSPVGQKRLLNAFGIICCLLDDALANGDVWLSIGLTRNKLKPLITLHEGGEDSYASGRTLDELLLEFERL